MYFKSIMLSILPIFFVVALSGCALGKKATPNEYELNLQKWQDANVLHYRFQLTNDYQGSPDRDTPVIIEVEDGKPISIISLSGGMIDGTSMEIIKKYATIDHIFQALKYDFAKADDVSVTYDSAYGYPIDIYTDIDLETSDDEESWRITYFEVLP